MLAAQFYRAAVDAVPGIPDEISHGNVSSLHGWLTDNIYRHGRIFPPNALIERATGSPLSPEPYLAYMRGEVWRAVRLARCLTRLPETAKSRAKNPPGSCACCWPRLP